MFIDPTGHHAIPSRALVGALVGGLGGALVGAVEGVGALSNLVGSLIGATPVVGGAVNTGAASMGPAGAAAAVVAASIAGFNNAAKTKDKSVDITESQVPNAPKQTLQPKTQEEKYDELLNNIGIDGDDGVVINGKKYTYVDLLKDEPTLKVNGWDPNAKVKLLQKIYEKFGFDMPSDKKKGIYDNWDTISATRALMSLNDLGWAKGNGGKTSDIKGDTWDKIIISTLEKFSKLDNKGKAEMRKLLGKMQDMQKGKAMKWEEIEKARKQAALIEKNNKIIQNNYYDTNRNGVPDYVESYMYGGNTYTRNNASQGNSYHIGGKDPDDPKFINEGTGNDYIIIDGSKYPDALSTDVRTAGFIARHPITANRIGKADPGKGKTDITNVAIRFSTNDLGLDENSAHEGSQVNAFRHALWQAIIRKTLGEDIALEVGNAHEENPYAIDGITDFGMIRYTTLSLADQSVDLLNNKIGRQIGKNVNSYWENDIAIATLNYYHDNGLWVARRQSDGNYAIVQEKLSDEQYKIAHDRLKLLDSNGFTKEQREKWNK